MPIFGGAYSLAREAMAASLEASHLLLEGAPTTYAACRPPGHHAGPNWLGGYCYLNNAMAAVEHLSRSGKRPIALLDLDFHFGDGSSAIAKRMSDVYFQSVHTSAVSEYPWLSEEPVAAGQLLTSLPAPPSEAGFLRVLDRLLDECSKRGVQAVVVSLGYDIVVGDPHGGWSLPPSVFAKIGRSLTDLELPVCFVQEGGYGIEQLAECSMQLATGVCGKAAGAPGRVVRDA
jgi:acetoin utilization deacetylase AcuC-like enzyme